jgi:hypothetical protein
MKRIITAAMLLTTTLLMTAAPKIKITNIEPKNWYAGMNDTKVQILITGEGIRDAEVTTDYPGCRIDSLVRLDSPNYLFVYADLSGAQPGEMPLCVTLGKKTKTIMYPLHKREMKGEERMGFTNADVLYMFMPDRFAQGRADNSKVKTQYPYTINRNEPSLRHGGDIEGVRQHLDYFVDLGVTALWLTPVLENDQAETATQSCYHGYATTNYYQVDPRFGSNDDYRRFIDAMKCVACGGQIVDYGVIEDFVFDIEEMYGVTVAGIAYDRFNAMSSAQKWERGRNATNLRPKHDGYPTVVVRQHSDTLHPPTKLLYELIMEGKFRYEENQLLEINFENARCTFDTNQNRYVNKKRSNGKVDMVVALINAMFLLQQNEYLGESMDWVVQSI